MEFKQAGSILISNFSLTFKLFLYIVVITLIVAAIAVGIFAPIMNLFLSGEAVGTIVSNFTDHANGFIKGNASLYDTFSLLKDDVGDMINYIISLNWFIPALVTIVIFIYLLYLFLFTLSSMPIADIINNSMASNLKYGYLSNFALNFRRSVRYSLAKIVVFFPIDLCILGVLVGLGYGIYFLISEVQILGYFGLGLMLVIGLVLASIRQTCFSGWIPRLIFHPDEGVFKALKNSFKFVKPDFGKLMLLYACIYFCLYFLVTVVGLFTFGLMSFLAPSISYVMLRIVELVSYYKINKLKFYTDSVTVVDTVDFGMRTEEQLTPEQLAFEEHKLNKNIREITFESTREEVLANPAFYEALKIGMSGERISASTLQIHLGITKSLAKAIIKTMDEMGFLESPNKLGTKAVKITQEQYDKLLLGEEIPKEKE